MRIWIDICNAPHVNFFKNLISEWAERGHETLVTARALSNTVPLLDRHGIEYRIVGGHSSGGIQSKALAFAKRCYSLHRLLRAHAVDVAISQSSYYSPVVARLLGRPSVYTNDNEHALGNYPAFACADLILLPEALKEWAAARVYSARVRYYPGVKEGIYLHEFLGRWPRRRVQGGSAALRSVFFRPEPWGAHYHRADRSGHNEMLRALGQQFDVTVLPRGEDQKAFYTQFQTDRIRVLSSSLTVPEIMDSCDAFIGAGGSMSRELAYLGLPTVSIYRGALLAVDRYLIEKGIMRHLSIATPAAVLAALAAPLQEHRSASLRSDGLAASRMILHSVEEVGRVAGK